MLKADPLEDALREVPEKLYFKKGYQKKAEDFVFAFVFRCLFPRQHNNLKLPQLLRFCSKIITYEENAAADPADAKRVAMESFILIV